MKTKLIFLLLTVSLVATRQARPDDKSYSVKTYIEKGLPSPDREWNVKDYKTATEALKKIATEDKMALPRKGSAASGPFFDRLVNPENLRSIKNARLPLPGRVREGGELIQHLSHLLLMYTSTDNKEYGPEALRITVFLLQTSEEGIILTHAFVAQLPAGGRNDPAVEASLKQMRSGTATMLTGILDMFQDEQNYHGKELERFAADLVSAFPPLFRRTEPMVQKELKIRVEKLMKSHKDEKVRESLAKLHKALEK